MLVYDDTICFSFQSDRGGRPQLRTVGKLVCLLRWIEFDESRVKTNLITISLSPHLIQIAKSCKAFNSFLLDCSFLKIDTICMYMYV